MKPIQYLFPAAKAGFFISISFVFFLSACAPTVTLTEPVPTKLAVVEEVQPAPTPASTEGSELEYVSREFVDALDRIIVVETPPLRIVSLAPSVTESLFAIGAGDLVVGRTEYCDFPVEAETRPIVGGFSSKSISIETILDLEPDLVIGGTTLQAEIITALETAKINSFVIQPEGVEEIIDSIQLLGMVTNRQDGADALVADMQSRINAITEVVSTISEEERLTVFYEVWHEPLMTTTPHTFIGELIQLAGGINIFANIEEAYPSVSAEQILMANPDVILGPSSHGDQLTVEVISLREGWQDLISVQNEAIYLVEGNIISRSGPRIVDALEMIAVLLYPEYYGEQEKSN
ncbi:ABC transporter substrate-binding protein [Chloroflexota bacterium]